MYLSPSPTSVELNPRDPSSGRTEQNHTLLVLKPGMNSQMDVGEILALLLLVKSDPVLVWVSSKL